MPSNSDKFFIKFVEEDEGKKEASKQYQDFTLQKNPVENVGPKITKLFFYTASTISFLFALAFLYLLLFSTEPIPDYMIGFIGSIIGFFIAKRPYEL